MQHRKRFMLPLQITSIPINKDIGIGRPGARSPIFWKLGQLPKVNYAKTSQES